MRRTSWPLGRRHRASLETLRAYSCRWFRAVCGRQRQGGGRRGMWRVGAWPAGATRAGLLRLDMSAEELLAMQACLPELQQQPAVSWRPPPLAATHRHCQHALLRAPVRPHVGALLLHLLPGAVQLPKLQAVLPAAPHLHCGSEDGDHILPAGLAAVDGLVIQGRGPGVQGLGPAIRKHTVVPVSIKQSLATASSRLLRPADARTGSVHDIKR